ncbi:MAG: HD domain-containing protein [Clostridia bacterium]|nr:HD domain-containing protein [Clostridia bacterium]MEE1116531.1 HD domain-containing protein [Clostridia bacterium]
MEEIRDENVLAANKNKFLGIFKEKITRDGADKLLEYLCSDKCDFFYAPASSRFHGSYVGGLLEHSLNVYECLCEIMPRLNKKYGFSYTDESLAISALLHDLCKVNFYRTEMRNVKKNGVWESVPYYTIEDNLPYGHGEKSVYIISGYMKLTRDEAFAIRYHMGFSGTEDKGNVGSAFEMFPLAYALAMADMEASYYIEGKPQKN